MSSTVASTNPTTLTPACHLHDREVPALQLAHTAEKSKPRIILTTCRLSKMVVCVLCELYCASSLGGPEVLHRLFLPKGTKHSPGKPDLAWVRKANSGPGEGEIDRFGPVSMRVRLGSCKSHVRLLMSQVKSTVYWLIDYDRHLAS